MVVADIRGRPLEQAQVLWQHALKRAGADEDREPLAEVIDVLAAADHDSTTLAHALALGRTQLRGEADIRGAHQAVRTLTRAVEFLGAKPLEHAAAMSGTGNGA
jgi:hypothetical protein